MFNLIKKIFKQKEKIGLPLEKLEGWFDEKTKELYKDIDKKINESKEKITEEIQKTKKNIDNLENAKLKNEDIPVKEKQFMQGNREFYINRINFFLDSLKIPEENVGGFLERMNTEII